MSQRVQHSRTKHIDVRPHFLRDSVSKGLIELLFISSENQKMIFLQNLKVKKDFVCLDVN